MASVSRVLGAGANSGTIHPEIVERVQRAAVALEYRPNPWARSLRTSRASTVCVIVSDLTLPFAVELLQVIHAGCRERGSHVLVNVVEDDAMDTQSLNALPRSSRVDGVIVIGGRFQRHSAAVYEEAMARLLQEYRHVVTVASHPSVAGESSIIVDDAAGVALAMDHLVSLGHTRIAHMRDGEDANVWENRVRSRAFVDALASHQLTHDPSLEGDVAPRDLAGAQATLGALMARERAPTAVFVDCDITAVTVLKAALLLGFAVPGDLSIVGFDDIEFAALCRPALSTVRQPIADMGARAVATLLDRIDEDLEPFTAGSDRTVVVPPTLVVRDSCGPPRVTQSP